MHRTAPNGDLNTLSAHSAEAGSPIPTQALPAQTLPLNTPATRPGNPLILPEISFWLNNWFPSSSGALPQAPDAGSETQKMSTKSLLHSSTI
jgi:hypothetical protein